MKETFLNCSTRPSCRCSPFLNQMKTDEKLPTSHLSVQVRFTESPSWIDSCLLSFVMEMLKSMREMNNLCFDLVRLNSKGESKFFKKKTKIKSYQRFLVLTHFFPLHWPFVELVINLKAYFPSSLCSTWCICSEQLFRLLPTY